MEVEKGGEVALEQFHITRLVHPAFNVRAGHLIVPVGLTNEQHEPINFFGTSRPEGETTLLPSTWHENGIEVFGTFGRGYTRFNYQALVVAGLNANGFDRNTWVAGGKQGLFETDNFTSPGYVARLNYLGVPGLKIGVPSTIATTQEPIPTNRRPTSNMGTYLCASIRPSCNIKTNMSPHVPT